MASQWNKIQYGDKSTYPKHHALCVLAMDGVIISDRLFVARTSSKNNNLEFHISDNLMHAYYGIDDFDPIYKYREAYENDQLPSHFIEIPFQKKAIDPVVVTFGVPYK